MINLKNRDDYAEVVRELLRSMIENDYDDLHIAAGRKIFVEHQRRFKVITESALTKSEAFELCDAIYGSETAGAEILSGNDLDFATEIKHKAAGEAFAENYRFRVNICPVTNKGLTCPAIAVRRMYAEIPEWSTLGFENEILENLRPKNGIILVTGATGSGKTTMLASAIQHIVLNRRNEKIVTFEDPIEYAYDEIESDYNIVEQSNKETNFVDFMTPMKSVLRRKPTISIVGEARDAETIRACLYVSETGHLVMTTLHTNGAPNTIKRILSEFPVNEQPALLANLVENVKMIVSQRIEPTTDGKKIAMREFLVIKGVVKEELEKATIHNVTQIVRKLTDEHGQSMVSHARKILDQGLITQVQFDDIAESVKEVNCE